MLNCSHNQLCLFFVTCLVFSCSACSTNIAAPNIGSTHSSIINMPALGEKQPNSQPEIDMEREAQIETLCLAAWRNCIAGHKKEALAQLAKLDKDYPKSSSVLLMTGQVLERSGKTKEAMAYYERSANNSDFATISLFKLAESLRRTGNTQLAIKRYEQLIAISPQFSAAHLGLAKALRKLDSESAKAKSEIRLALRLDPNNKEAKALLAQQ